MTAKHDQMDVTSDLAGELPTNDGQSSDRSAAVAAEPARVAVDDGVVA